MNHRVMYPSRFLSCISLTEHCGCLSRLIWRLMWSMCSTNKTAPISGTWEGVVRTLPEWIQRAGSALKIRETGYNLSLVPN